MWDWHDTDVWAANTIAHHYSPKVWNAVASVAGLLHASASVVMAVYPTTRAKPLLPWAKLTAKVGLVRYVQGTCIGTCIGTRVGTRVGMVRASVVRASVWYARRYVHQLSP